LDVVCVSIDLERARIVEQSTEAPPIKEVGIAELDTQELISATSKHPATKLITTTQFFNKIESVCLQKRFWSRKKASRRLLQTLCAFRATTLQILSASGTSFLLVTQSN
jgi:hypothetical protein